MQLRRLELVDVRSYDHTTVRFPDGVTVLVGPNAQGKTNLLEAVQRVATGSSHRVAGDAPLVRAGRDVGVIRTAIETDDQRTRSLELEVASGRRTRVKVDGQDVRRAAEAVGVLRTVLFAPEDLRIVRGDPGDRRRYLDELLALRRPAFAAVRADHDRALRQRNQLLRQARSSPGSSTQAATIDVWTDQLIQTGAQVIAARFAALRALAGPIERCYQELADRPEPIGLAYRSSAGSDLDELARSAIAADDPVPATAPIAAALEDAYRRAAGEERQRGQTLIGPQRDDVELTIGALPARGYASHGEAWSLALALKLSTFELLGDIGDRPVVLLDDVFAELDTTRRSRLAAACERFDQVLVTAAVEEDVPLEGHRIDVVISDGVSSLTPRDDLPGSP